ncbi:hypothetical protein ABC255_08860 [Neobacillus sp. 3P2-tot-E-2]
MKERKSFITEETIINIDEDVFKVVAQQLLCELFVEYVNNKYGKIVIELR